MREVAAGRGPFRPGRSAAGRGCGQLCPATALDGRRFLESPGRVLRPHDLRLRREPTVDLGAILGFVDANLYGWGRQPLFDAGNQIIGWRLVDPDKVQDPTVIVPLNDADRRQLRQILRLPAGAELPALLDIG